MDVWVAVNPENADRIVVALKQFGFTVPELSAELFLRQNQIVRMGLPPVRIELMTTISGVEFQECYAAKVVAELDGIKVNLIEPEVSEDQQEGQRQIQRPERSGESSMMAHSVEPASSDGVSFPTSGVKLEETDNTCASVDVTTYLLQSRTNGLRLREAIANIEAGTNLVVISLDALK